MTFTFSKLLAVLALLAFFLAAVLCFASTDVTQKHIIGVIAVAGVFIAGAHVAT